MSDTGVQVALITAGGAVVVALLGVMSAVLVELIRSRKQRASVDTGIAKVVTEVTPNGGTSIKDAVGRIETDVREIRKDQNRHGQRLAAVEAQMSMHLRLRPIPEEAEQ